MFRCHINYFDQSAENSAFSGLEFSVVEQALNLPLWLISTFPTVSADPSGCKSQMIASDARATFHILSDVNIASAEVFIVLPSFMTNHQSKKLVRCLGIWKGRHKLDSEHLVWGFDTDENSYVDPLFAIDLSDAVKSQYVWRSV